MGAFVGELQGAGVVIDLMAMDPDGIRWAQQVVAEQHYLHSPVDVRCSVEGYKVFIGDIGCRGILLFGRPQATRCSDWYGSVDDVECGRCEVTRWQVLNLARVWLDPVVQVRGEYCRPDVIPGFVDRRGVFRSTLASTVLKTAIERIGYDYLVQRPPVFLDEPYEIKWLLSYCDTKLHKGTIYQAAGFERYRINSDGIETWRIRLPALGEEQDNMVRYYSERDSRAQRYRAERAQLRMF